MVGRTPALLGRLSAIERYERDGKAPGKRNGPIGYIGLNIAGEVARACGSSSDVASIGIWPIAFAALSAMRSLFLIAIGRKTGTMSFGPGSCGRSGKAWTTRQPRNPTYSKRASGLLAFPAEIPNRSCS
jgi:hypothetical protein